MSIFTRERESVEKLVYVKNMKDEMNFDLGSNKNTPEIMLRDVPIVDDSSKKLGFYVVHALEEEMKKIEAFKRELPHCMHLLRDAIESLKEENGREMGEELEFAVMRNYGQGEARAKASNDITEKKNWMSSVQLYTPDSRNQDSVFHLTGRFFEEGEGSGRGNHSGRNEGGAFSPFKKTSDELKEKQRTAPINGLSLAVPEAEVATNDLTVNGFRRVKLEQPRQEEQQKKHRRCWSPELHKIFVDALHQLGGAQTATPKQIRELMRVDGLTNDEVKSHLQKYRIHIKKVDSAGASSSREQLAVSGSPQGPLQGGKAAKGGSAATGGDSVDDDDDGRSESIGWKGKLQKPFL